MNEFNIKQGETLEEFQWRLGSLKEQGTIHLTWPELAKILNDTDPDNDYTESYWRKRYRQMRLDKAEKDGVNVIEAQQHGQISFFTNVEKQRIRARDERMSYTRILRDQARKDAILEQFEDAIVAFEPPAEVPSNPAVSHKAVYAMQSDIHYGITFESYAGKYDSDIACSRVMQYANEIIRIGKNSGAGDCYVSLMGDLISGIIHTTIRIENRENLIEQVVGVSELIAAFLAKLATHFENVIVNSVDGNHSRVDFSADDALRAEKQDALIPWYCQTKLQNLSNVHFSDSALDSSIGNFNIFGKTYVCVHGDMDNDQKASVQRIEPMLGTKIDYMLAGHMHVADARLENIGFIRNGSVCGSGDEYTVKKRLFGPPVQVCMVVTETGVEAIYPVKL